MTSDDAGDLLQTLDQTAQIDGGQLKLKAAILRQAPALDAQALSRSSSSPCSMRRFSRGC